MKVQDGKQRCSQFIRLPVDERVDLYLHGVNKYRPSDYSLGDCFAEISPELFDELLVRLSSSADERTAFALILVLHGTIKNSYSYNVPRNFKATAHCFQSPACLTLAGDIDNRLQNK